MEELVGAHECLYILHLRYSWMGDSFFWMAVGTDGHWVNQLVEDNIPRFCFFNDSDWLGEDHNDVLDFDGNNNQ